MRIPADVRFCPAARCDQLRPDRATYGILPEIVQTATCRHCSICSDTAGAPDTQSACRPGALRLETHVNHLPEERSDSRWCPLAQQSTDDRPPLAERTLRQRECTRLDQRQARRTSELPHLRCESPRGGFRCRGARTGVDDTTRGYTTDQDVHYMAPILCLPQAGRLATHAPPSQIVCARLQPARV